MGDTMDIKMTLFAIFAIFCVLGSACAISAADDFGDDGYVGVGYDDVNTVDDSGYDDRNFSCGRLPDRKLWDFYFRY